MSHLDVLLIKKCVHRKRKRSGVCEEEQLSCCAVCQDVLKDPVSTSCGHWFCRQCISAYWDQLVSSEDSSCPQCGKRSKTRAGLQTANQSSCVQSKTEQLSADGLISKNLMEILTFLHNSTVVRWLAMLAHSKKVLSSIPPSGPSLSVWSLHVLPMFAWVLRLPPTVQRHSNAQPTKTGSFLCGATSVLRITLKWPHIY
uniref:RING-type domain-containing protein n=1 Tax=Oreochromis aureus TaxID=47969 RepID=A0AAZ1XQI3_OREAU